MANQTITLNPGDTLTVTAAGSSPEPPNPEPPEPGTGVIALVRGNQAFVKNSFSGGNADQTINLPATGQAVAMNGKVGVYANGVFTFQDGQTISYSGEQQYPLAGKVWGLSGDFGSGTQTVAVARYEQRTYGNAAGRGWGFYFNNVRPSTYIGGEADEIPIVGRYGSATRDFIGVIGNDYIWLHVDQHGENQRFTGTGPVPPSASAKGGQIAEFSNGTVSVWFHAYEQLPGGANSIFAFGDPGDQVLLL